MAKRRPLIEALEQRLCLAAPTLQTSVTLPQGSWTETVYRASPLFADIFNTGKDELIAVASGAQIVAYSENADGSATPIIDYKVPAGVADIKSTPVVVTDPRTGRKDLFAAMGRDETHDGTIEDSRVFGWDLQTGNLLPAWVNGVSDGNSPGGLTGSYGAIATGDLNGDGIPDLVVTSFSQEVTAMTIDGTILWQWENNDTIVSGAVIADIDRDGKPEVIVGGDSSANTVYTQFQAGGWVNVLSNTGQLKWRHLLPGEVTWSSPIVADLNNNGYLDIVIGTGDNFSDTLTGAAQNAAIIAGDNVYAFDPFGNMLPGWPYHTVPSGSLAKREILGSPVAADLLGNGQLEVVALDRQGFIHVIMPNGQDMPGFEGGKSLAPEFPPSQLPDDYGTPIIADVTGAGKPDIVATYGPFVRAFDTSGNLIPIGTSKTGSLGLPEAFDIAPAVGNFDGSGGLTLATVSFNIFQLSNGVYTNPPDQVQIYRLPQSVLAPPWPMLRRVAAGDAVARSPIYDQQYVVQAFNTLMGSPSDAGTVALYVNALNDDLTNLLSTAQLIASSTPVRQSEVSRIYQRYLGHPANAFALTYWTTYLAGHTYRQMESVVASSTEFAQRAGGSFNQEVVQLYQAILNRTPGQAEINIWVNAKLPISSVATILINSAEGISDQFAGIIQAMFGPGTQGLIPPDDLAAFSLDTHTGEGEENLIATVLASAANYASTNFVAGQIENLYRDILLRMGSPSDVAFWLTAIDNQSVAFGSLAADFLNSTEARMDYVQSEFIALLGHGADPGTLLSLANYTKRENIVILIVSSPEYFADHGSNNTSFVVAAFLDIDAIVITPAAAQGLVSQINAGMSRAQIASEIIYSATLYFSTITVNQLMYYIPLESQGVLRSGDSPANAPGQPINPDPNLVNYFLGLYESGLSQEQVLSIMLNTPQYYAESSYYRGLFRALGVRN